MPFKNKEDKLDYNRTYLREYRKNNREKILSYQRKYRKNPGVLAKNAERLRKDRKLHPERFAIYSQKQNLRTRKIVKERLRNIRLEMGGKCSRCGYDECVDILHFHHTGDKFVEVTRLIREEAIRNEAKKCELLCPNCHAIEHFAKYYA